MVERRCQRPPILWWSLVLMTAATLKYFYSVAAVTQLGWMLEPITLLLRLLAGWHFTLNSNGEWLSVDAGIALVKACAGINFMIMSLLAWCWAIRPRERTPQYSLLVEWPLLLAVALILAWFAALTANTMRIWVVVQAQPMLERWFTPESAHRTLGLLVYLPALCMQVLLTEWRRRDRALLIVCAIYAGVMLAVPLATGNAMADLALYAEHAALVMGALMPLALGAIVLHPRRR